MAEIIKPDFTNALWASGGAIVAPSNVKIATGWTAEVPPFQWENYSQNRQDQGIAHILQHGISTWDALTEYQAAKSYVQGSNGRLYIAVVTHTNQNPVADVNELYWADIFKQGVSVYATAGTFSWPVPHVVRLGLRRIKVTVVGGGGGGGGVQCTTTAAAGGGGGGGGVQALLSYAGATSVSLTVGAGGAGGQSANGWTGQPGVTSSFGGIMTASGGSGGIGLGNLTQTQVLSGGEGGYSSLGDTNARGNGGTDGTIGTVGNGAVVYGGNGGGGAFFGGGRDGGSTIAGQNGSSYGEGGSGAAVNNQAFAGGNGAAGVVKIEW